MVLMLLVPLAVFEGMMLLGWLGEHSEVVEKIVNLVRMNEEDD